MNSQDLTTPPFAATGEVPVTDVDALPMEPGTPRRSGWRAVLRGAFGLGRARLGLTLVGLIVLIAVFGPLVAPHAATDLVAAPYAQPSSAVPLGADALGHDVLSRCLRGGLHILVLSLLATILGVGAGTFLGVLAGYRRGVWDNAIMRSLDVLLAIPAIVLAMLLMSVLGTKSWLLVVAVAAAHAPQVARVLRGAAVQMTGREFVVYAETIGISRRRIILGELIPNLTAPLMVELGLRMTYSIAAVASLAFLGFGQQPPAADWGLMINENRGGITIQPWGVLAPVILIAVLTIGMNLITDAFARSAAGIDREMDAEA